MVHRFLKAHPFIQGCRQELEREKEGLCLTGQNRSPAVSALVVQVVVHHSQAILRPCVFTSKSPAMGECSASFITIQKFYLVVLNIYSLALTGMAQWMEHGPANQRVASLTPSQGTCEEATTH